MAICRTSFFKIIVIVVTMCVNNTYGSIALVINQPGYYKIGSNLIASPTIDNDMVIQIQSSNVILDMDGYVISQDPLSTATGLTGIVIDDGYGDIRITNFVIIGVTGAGIKVGAGCEDIQINNLYLGECQEGGIYLAGTSGNDIQRVIISNTYITGAGIVPSNNGTGIVGEYVRDFAFINCGCLKNGSVATDDVIVFYIDNGVAGRYADCFATNNQARLNISAFYAINSSKVTYRNCRAVDNHNNDTGASLVAGVHWVNCTSMLCQGIDITANENIDDMCSGVHMASTGTANVVMDNLISDNIGTTTCSGIYLEDQYNAVIEGNECRSNSATAGSGYGINIAQSTGNNNCLLRGNFLMANTGSVTGIGINDASSTSTNCIIQNTAFNNATNYSVTYGGGVTLPVISGSLSNSSPGMPSTTAGNLSNISVEL